jgi:phosphatidylethanolamine/phosphatidyl-N-methylethanolamine N-methyltransferase
MSENWTFFKQWIRHPARLGTFLPIHKKFSEASIKTLIHDHKLKNTLSQLKVVELGAGTGSLTQTLLQEGFRDISAIELDSELSHFLNQKLGEQVKVLNIDATDLEKYIDRNSVDIVISALPFMYIPLPIRQKIIDASFAVLKDTGTFWHTCYTPSGKMFQVENMETEKKLTQWDHFPTGFVYEFKPIAQQKRRPRRG